ncbi:hypothetical protein HY995_03920 [Candidatus Micrarchaeota archaeon]|nr:hypothetical protein [Candidatus Micrarchaeota archaeon]MBI5177205.1 hypothetical protein [Candidatus Micrarchaeota archaeon]
MKIGLLLAGIALIAASVFASGYDYQYGVNWGNAQTVQNSNDVAFQTPALNQREYDYLNTNTPTYGASQYSKYAGPGYYYQGSYTNPTNGNTEYGWVFQHTYGSQASVPSTSATPDFSGGYKPYQSYGTYGGSYTEDRASDYGTYGGAYQSDNSYNSYNTNVNWPGAGSSSSGYSSSYGSGDFGKYYGATIVKDSYNTNIDNSYNSYSSSASSAYSSAYPYSYGSYGMYGGYAAFNYAPYAYAYGNYRGSYPSMYFTYFRS